MTPIWKTPRVSRYRSFTAVATKNVNFFGSGSASNVAGQFKRRLTANFAQGLKANECGGLDLRLQCEISMPEHDVPLDEHRLDGTHVERLQFVLKHRKNNLDVIQTCFKIVLRW
jgi:hypothetical protein